MGGLRILITGGLGFIGSNLARRCVDLGARVTVCDSLDGRAGANLFNINDIQSHVTLAVADVRQASAVATLLDRQDVVFHCAALTSHAGSMSAPFEDLDVNCRGTLTLLEGARLVNPSVRIVYLGTSTQIGRLKFASADELHPEFPTDIYSAHKSLGEKYALIYANAYGLAATVIRFANVYGPRAHIRTNRLGFMNFFIGCALQDKELTVFGQGTQLRSVLFVEDCVEALLLAALSVDAAGQVFVAASDERYSVKEIAERIVEVIGAGRVKQVDWPRDKCAIDVGDAVFTNRRIKAALGWAPHLDLSAGLAVTRDFFRSRLEHYLK